jgi:acetyl esterase/lipase
MRILLLLLLLCACAHYDGPSKYATREKVFYTPAKIERQMGELLIPEGPGPFPAVLLVHGGGWNSRNYEDLRSVARSLAKNGIVAFSINYRYAPEFHHPAPVDDLDGALEFLKAHSAEYKVDVKRIGLWGYSSGGHTVSYYALKNAADPRKKVQAVVSGGAPYDFTWYPLSPYIKGYLGEFRDEMLQEYMDASPSHILNKDAPPFLLYHGYQDKLVEFAQAAAFEAKLKYQGTAVERVDVSFWGHSMTFIWADEPVRRGIKFLKHHLSDTRR